MKAQIIQTHKSFEEVKHLNENSEEFWLARELAPILEYARWESFQIVVERAMIACNKSGNDAEDHFRETTKMVDLGSGSKREIKDFMLSRYACYLIVQNADPSKEVIANGQTYFAVQTRKQELAENDSFESLNEDKKRILLRNQLKEHNKQLMHAASGAGVESGIDFAIFQNHGYKGLYGGLDNKDIHKRKGLKKSQQISDFMGSAELAANLFRATQTEEKLKNENIQGKQNANKVHYDVGHKVRQTIEEIGGTLPENLETPTTSVVFVEKKYNKQIKSE